MAGGQITFTLKPSNMSEKLLRLKNQGISYGIGRAAMLAETILLQLLKLDAPKATGAYAASIMAQKLVPKTGTIAVRFMAKGPLSGFITSGTRPHDIEPALGSCLVFEVSNGDIVFTTLVHHPGTRPNPFYEKSVSRFKPILMEGLKSSIHETIQSLK
jgi:hypothetical protein